MDTQSRLHTAVPRSRPGFPQMALHYPLNGIDLDFRRYGPRPLEARDVMVNRIMEDYMKPRRLKPSTYLRPVDGISLRQPDFGLVKSQDRELGLDMQLLWELLATERRYKPEDFTDAMWLWKTLRFRGEPRGGWVTLENMLPGVIRRYFLEIDPALSYFLKYYHHFHFRPKPMPTPGWKKDMTAHLRQAQTATTVQNRNFVFSGNFQLPLNGPAKRKMSIDPYLIAIPKLVAPRFTRKRPRKHKSRPWDDEQIYLHNNPPIIHRDKSRLLHNNPPIIHRGRPRRSQSAPLPGSWFSTHLPTNPTRYCLLFYFLYAPTRPLSELDKLSRRRSLSRTHVRAMFRDPPRWIVEDSTSGRPSPQSKHPCTNCAQYTHPTEDCPSNCGYCNSNKHKARNCTTKAINRCKCRPFPQYHTAVNCFVPCSRKCGSAYPPSHSKHKSAMLCSSRCCMCGVKGHTGRKCSLERCPCGVQHLTQDCRWKVECPARSCDRYLCTLHCKECGERKGSEGDFVGRTCQNCLKNGMPVSPKAENPEDPRE